MSATTHTIDATGKKLGRIATEAAVILMGKHVPGFRKNVMSGDKVLIKNASKISIDDRKLRGKTYTRYSGYPGGFKSAPLKEVVEKKGYGEAFRRAVRGMLPQNKLRDRRIKNLTVEE